MLYIRGASVRYVVTGASGFIGCELSRRLLGNGHQVTTLDRDGQSPLGCDIVRGELEDLRACERLINEHRPDVVFHLAAQAIVGHAVRDPHSTMESNVRGTYNILEAFRRHRPRHATMVVASSDKAYGEMKKRDDNQFETRAYKESDPLEGRGPYDVSKSCADLITRSYAETYDLPIGVVRAGNVYGPGDFDRSRIIPSVIDDLKNERVPIIRSDGTPVRDYLYIDDAVSAYISLAELMENRRGGMCPFNFSGGEPISVLNLVKMMMSLAGAKGEPTVTGERKYEIQEQMLDCRKAYSCLEWQPQYGLKKGLQITMAAAGIYTNR